MHDVVSTTIGSAAGSTKLGRAAGSTMLGRTAGLVLTAAVLVVGTALGGAAPASADRSPEGTDRPTEAGTGDAGVQLGPATKFVREPDGSVRQVR